MALPVVTAENYYSPEMNMAYMGSTQFKAFEKCEAAALVAADEHDTGVRRLLNFGHTLGHAIEAAGGYEACTHGEAVAAGMAAILRWQLHRGDGVQAAYDRLLALLERWGLAAGLPCDSETARRYLARDKKREGDMVHAVLLRAIGDAYVEDVLLSALGEEMP